MILIYIIVLLLLWYVNMLALTALVGTKKGGTLKVVLIAIGSLVISLVDFYIPVIILVAVILVILGKIKKII